MARDRERAKDRKARERADGADAAGNGADLPLPSEPAHENTPNDWEHASGDVDIAGASIVQGGDGDPLDAPGDEELERQAAAAAPVARATPGQPTERGSGRFVSFLRASWAELQRVQWPDRRQVGQATAVVLGFVVVAGAYLGLADKVAKEIVDLIL